MLDAMVVAYDRGLLVPLIGAGMSFDRCPLWDCFVENLETSAKVQPRAHSDLVQRSAHAVRKLSFGTPSGLASGVASALSREPSTPPPQTVCLAQIFWPLVLTTNYDDHYIAAAYDAHLTKFRSVRLSREEKSTVPVLLLGRAESDCQRVLSSLRQPDAPILWALQGFVGGQSQVRRMDGSWCRVSELGDTLFNGAAEALKGELVVGHAEYRRVAASAPHFRRAFGEVFRSRSLLFLGSGLGDKYFLDLFSEIIELYGPCPYPHFAVMRRGESDVGFLRDYFGIRVHEIESHEELPAWLGDLEKLISGPRLRRLSWIFGSPTAVSPELSRDCGALAIVRGKIPDPSAPDECIAFSAGGGSGQPRLSSIGLEVLNRYNLDAKHFTRYSGADPDPAFVWTHTRDRRFIGVNARLNPWTDRGAEIRPVDPLEFPLNPRAKRLTAGGRVRRDLRIIPPAVQELMSAAQELQFRRVHAVLLASGKLRTFPQSFGLCQMMRGWARWRRQHTEPVPALTIYITAVEVLYNLDAQRLDFSAYLAPDQIDFWIEIRKHRGRSERYLHSCSVFDSVRQILSQFAIESEDWRLDLVPRPCLDWANWTVAGIHTWEERFQSHLTVERFGVLPGSLLSVTQAGVEA